MVNKSIEKYAIFSSGFRGLPNGWHNLRSCNFLVGENSTGKSSFLHLIDIIDSREHMIFLDILGIVKGIDTATDICSRISGAKSTTVGFLIKERPLEDGKKQRNFFGRLATYEKSKEEMKLKKLTILVGNNLLKLKTSNGKILYRFESFTYFDHETHAQNGNRLTDTHNRPRDRFKSFSDDMELTGEEPSDWVDAIRAATTLRMERSAGMFLGSYAPLSCVHYGPMRAKPRRLFHGSHRQFSPTGEHMAFVLRDIASQEYSLMESIEKFGRDSGLFDRIAITSVKTPVKDRPFALQVEKSNSFYYVDELGFGVSQILPIIGDLAFAPPGISFLVEQPELHLHPKAQAALGNIFYEKMVNGTALVIETHSDFIIDRFRMAVKNSKNKELRSQIIYFEKTPHGENKCHEIEICPDGSLSEIPDGYRDFFLNEGIDKFEALQ